MLEIIFTIAGALIGAAIADEEGLVAGGLLGLMLGFVISTRVRLRRHDRELAALRTRLDAVATELPPVEFDLSLPDITPDPGQPSANAADARTASATHDPQASATPPAAEPAAGPVPAPESDFASGTPTPLTRPSTRSAPDFGHSVDPDLASAEPLFTAAAPHTEADATGTSAEPPGNSDRSNPIGDAVEAVKAFVRGANTMVLVGVVVLFFGFAFLAKLAIDANLVSIEMRLAGIAGVGIVLLLAGWRFRHERRTFALPLQGGGVGIMFLTVFAAYRLYGLIPAEMCFGLLVLLVVFGVILAVLQDAPAMASLAVSGGFLAPVLASTGSGDHVALFSYYLLLNAGILAIAWFKAWRVLNLLGFLFTFIIGSLWGAKYYRPELFSSTEPFLLGHFVLYTAVSILFALRQPTRLRGLVDGTLVFGTPLVVFALQSQLVSDFEMGLAWSAVGGAAFYIVLATILARKADFRLLLEAFVANGVVLATIAVPLALDARWTSVTWAIEGAGVLWVGVRQDRRLPRFAGALLQLLAGAAWLTHVDAHPLYTATLFANPQFLGGALIALAGLFCGAYLHRSRARLQPYEQVFASLLGSWALVWWYGGGLWELAERAPHTTDWGVLLMFLAISVVAFTWLYSRMTWPVLRLALTGHVLLMLFTAIVMAFDENQPFVALAWLGWPAAVLGQLIALRSLDDWDHPVRGLVHAALLWLSTVVLAWGAGYWLDRWLGGRDLFEPVAFGLIPAMIVMMASRATGGDRWPIGVYASEYLRIALGPIVALLIVWMWVINLSPPGSEWPIEYLPVMNPIDITNGFALLAMFTWWRCCTWRLDNWPAVALRSPISAVVAATVFVFANAMLFRAIHFWADVPYDLHSLWREDITQSSLAIFWSVLGVSGMWVAARKYLRTVWFVAAALMGVVVLKLFFVDLANTDTLERVISFVSVGLLMVVVGYFAPVPPRAASDPDDTAPAT